MFEIPQDSGEINIVLSNEMVHECSDTSDEFVVNLTKRVFDDL